MIKSSQQWPAAMISKKAIDKQNVMLKSKKKLIEPQLRRNNESKSSKSAKWLKINKKTMKNNEKSLNILAQGAQGAQGDQNNRK